jgi:DNA-binding CsgD family transcriptional regulator
VIHLLAEGFNRQEVAELLTIKLNTVNNHIARAREFNGCENLEDLLRRYRFWDYST